MTPKELIIRVGLGQLIFSLGVTVTLALLGPTLLLLDHAQARAAVVSISLSLAVALVLSISQALSLIWARRGLLSQLSNKRQREHQHIEIPKLNDDPWHITNAWLFSSVFSMLVAMTGFRPAAIPASMALIICLFSSVLLAAASLPLLVFVRQAFVRLMEQVPPDIMAEIIDAQLRSGRLRGRTSRRLLAAIATPVGFLVIGSVLIVGAHLRALNDQIAGETAHDLLQSTLSPDPTSPGVLSPATPGVAASLAALAKHGFQVQLLGSQVQAPQSKSAAGVVELVVPLGKQSARVFYRQTSGWTVSWMIVPVALVTVFGAVWTALAMARLLSRDLRMANHGVRMLGTDAALDGTRVMQPARFRAVVELSTAIESLSDRFRQFAQAQSMAVSAREAATRSRGRFFASVSHDLKSPLNAILGFAEITRADPSMHGPQQESLDMILKRGKELLILVETILDAARVEAGQLHLEMDDQELGDLLESALNKARDLTSDSDILTRIELPAELPVIGADQLRLSHALATFLAHARRTAERESLRVLVECEPRPDRPSLRKRKITIHIEIPSSKFSARELEGMLHPEMHPGQHRGLSLALRLAKSVVELHGGQVAVTGRTVREPAFAITLFGRAGR